MSRNVQVAVTTAMINFNLMLKELQNSEFDWKEYKYCRDLFLKSIYYLESLNNFYIQNYCLDSRKE